MELITIVYNYAVVFIIYNYKAWKIQDCDERHSHWDQIN